MKSKFKERWMLFLVLLISMFSIAQVKPNHSLKSKTETKMKDQQGKSQTTRFVSNGSGNIALIDKLVIPAASIDELLNQTNKIGKFIKTLPGLISQQAYEHTDSEGTMTMITVAIWENQDALSKAKDAVQAEFQRLNLQPQELFKRLNVKMERSVYNLLEN